MENRIKALRAKYSAKAAGGGPLPGVIIAMLAQRGLFNARVQYFQGEGYKVTVNSVDEVFKAEEVGEEIERKYGVSVYVAY